MPTDLTGTPTSLGIGTFNVDADAPSGLGFNEAMAQIDALIAGRIGTPAGILTGDVPVWNGSTFIRSSSLGLSPSGISGYPNNVGKFLRGDGSWNPVGTYRKTSIKSVINTTTETDLLNGEITIGAGVLGTTGSLRLKCFGTLINTSGSTVALPRLKLKLGATTIMDSGLGGVVWGSTSAFEGVFEIEAKIVNEGAANSQWASLKTDYVAPITAASAVAPLTVGNGLYWANNSSDIAGLMMNNSAAVDTTVAQALALTATLGTANATLSMNLVAATVEII